MTDQVLVWVWAVMLMTDQGLVWVRTVMHLPPTEIRPSGSSVVLPLPWPYEKAGLDGLSKLS